MPQASSRPDRIRTFLKAVIEFNNGASKNDCTVKNISASGARLDITASVGLPDEFYLRIPHRGELRRCKLIWREADAVGVHFITSAKSPTSPMPAANNLEAENARLRSRVRELTRRLEELGQSSENLETCV